MILKLEGSVGEEMVNMLITAHNECPPDDDLEVYFCSEGGSVSDMEVLIDIINESDKIGVVNVFGIAYSAGFILPMRIHKYVNFMNGCLGMMHRASFTIGHLKDDLTVAKDIKREMKLMSDNAKQLSEDVISLGIFNDAEIKKIRKGQDVFFSTERLREMREIIWQPIQEEINKAVEEWKNSTANEEDLVKEEVAVIEKTPTKKKANKLAE